MSAAWPPSSQANDRLPAWAERLVLFLDDGYVVPGTKFRIGFDALLGLVPGVGDLMTTASSLSLLWLAHQRRVPKTVFTRMLVNVGLDAVVGAIPILGDIFDVVYKANRRNLTLLERYNQSPQAAATGSGGFLAMVVVAVILLLTIPMVLALLIVRAIFE